MSLQRVCQNRSDVLNHTTHPCDSQDDSPDHGGDGGGPNMDHTIRSVGNILCSTIRLPRSFRNTMDRTILPSIRCSTKGHTNPSWLHSTMGRTIRDISMGRNSMNAMENNACSSTMSCLCCKDRTNNRNCSRGRISSRKGFLLL